MKNILLGLFLSSAITTANAAFFYGNSPESSFINLNPINSGQLYGKIYDSVGWDSSDQSTWKIEYLGSSADFTNKFFISFGNLVFNNKTASVGDTSFVVSEFDFLFSSKLGSVSKDNNLGNSKPLHFFSSIGDAGNSLTLWLDDGGANNDRDYNDMGVKITAVPLPAAFWLFLSGLIGVVTIIKRKI